MRKLLLLFMLLCTLGYAQKPPGQNATFTLQADTHTSTSTCSATAIGPHALLTASHCEMPVDEVEVNGTTVHVDKIIRDKNDHSIFLISGITFKAFVEVVQNEYFIGQAFHVWGSPSSYEHLYRKGYICGVIPTSRTGRPTLLVLDFNGFFGDSGAGLLNDAGQLFGVVSGLDDKKASPSQQSDAVLKLMGAYEMAFEPGDLHKARNYGVTSK